MRIARGLLAVAFLLIAAGPAAGACGDDPGDAAALAGARAQVDTDCDCAGAASHAGYVLCALDVAQQRALSPACARAVRRCAARSTCGRPGFVTCCRTRGGATRCAIERSAAACAAPAGGSACVGTFTSCCDACTAGGCTPQTTTSTTTSTTTTTTFPFIPCNGGVPPSCGGTCDPGLSCAAMLTAPNTFECACVPTATGCGVATVFPVCSVGVCPENFQCGAAQQFDLTTGFSRFCFCMNPAVQCLRGPGDMCVQFGLCPPGLVCSYAAVIPKQSCPCCGCGSPVP